MVETNHLAYMATVAGSAEECTELNSLRFVSLKKKIPLIYFLNFESHTSRSSCNQIGYLTEISRLSWPAARGTNQDTKICVLCK